MSETEFTDILVDVVNPEALDTTLRMLPGAAACVVGCGTERGPEVVDGHYVVRVFGPPGFVEFAMRNQGYARVIGRRSK